MAILCVLCDNNATKRAAQMPVCKLHWEQYRREAEQQLPLSERRLYWRMLNAWRRMQVENTGSMGREP